MTINRRLIDLLTKGNLMDSRSKLVKGLLDETEVDDTPIPTSTRPVLQEFAPMSRHQMIFGVYKATPLIKIAVTVDGKKFEETKLATPGELITNGIEVTPAPNSKSRIKIYVGVPNVHPVS